MEADGTSQDSLHYDGGTSPRDSLDGRHLPLDMKHKHQEQHQEGDHLPNDRPLSPAKEEKMDFGRQYIVRLDVGGFKFTTTLTTLTSDPSSMLAAMFSGRFPLDKNEDGYIFIDRDGRYFHHILNWLRNGTMPPIESPTEREVLLLEARFYQIPSLIEFLSAADTQIHPEKEQKDKDPPLTRFTLKEVLHMVNISPSKKKVQLPSADLSELNLNGISLPCANLKFTNLEHCSLQQANLQEASMQYACLAHADLQNADLSMGNLAYSNLQHAKLNNANLQGCNLQYADMANCDLQGANLQGANLVNANLQGANLQYTNLFGAKLQGASLHGILNVQYAKGLRR